MAPRHFVIAVTSDLGDFKEEVQRVFSELGRQFGSEPLAGDCSPTLDVLETDDAMEITVDLPGVEPETVRVLGKGDAILIAGEKPPRRVKGESSFHLVERGYGRFARAVRVLNACDIANATATLADGELRISLPKLKDRRGQARQIAIQKMAD
jgi:HSP20 family protein